MPYLPPCSALSILEAPGKRTQSSNFQTGELPTKTSSPDLITPVSLSGKRGGAAQSVSTLRGATDKCLAPSPKTSPQPQPNPTLRTRWRSTKVSTPFDRASLNNARCICHLEAFHRARGRAVGHSGVTLNGAAEKSKNGASKKLGQRPFRRAPQVAACDPSVLNRQIYRRPERGSLRHLGFDPPLSSLKMPLPLGDLSTLLIAETFRLATCTRLKRFATPFAV